MFINMCASLLLTNLADRRFREGEHIQFEVGTAYSGAGQPRYSLSSDLPPGAGASFNTQTRVFRWQPNFHSPACIR